MGWFFLICSLHSLVSITGGALMMFYSAEVTAIKSQGSTPHDQLLIRTSDSFSGLLLVAIGLLLIMVGFVRDRAFQGFFAKGCVVLHVGTAVRRFYFVGGCSRTSIRNGPRRSSETSPWQPGFLLSKGGRSMIKVMKSCPNKPWQPFLFCKIKMLPLDYCSAREDAEI